MRYSILSSIVLCISGLCLQTACNNEDDRAEMLDFNEVQGRQIEFDFKGITEEYGITRSTPLPTSVTVWVTTDEGRYWYPYIWDESKKLWKPKSTAVTWTNRIMTIYAAVRGDLTDDTWSNTFTIQPNQTTSENLLKSDFLGARQHVSYTSGRITMTLQHRIAKLIVLAQLDTADDKANLNTCETISSSIRIQNTASTGHGKIPITGSITCGGLNVDVNANIQQTVDEEIIYSQDDAQYYDFIKFYKDNNANAADIDKISGLASERTAVFYAYFINQSKKAIGLKFTYNKNGTTYTLSPNFRYEQGGIGLEAGCNSCITLFMPQVQ